MVISKTLNTKLLIPQELLGTIIHFSIHYETLFNTLLLAINRSQDDKIP